MEVITIVSFLAGIALLVVGGELLVRGGSRLAVALGISPLVVGLTIVAFGTSAPELAVSLQAALAHRADLAIGNIVGSNISNVLLILGVSAIISPLAVSQQLVRVDVPIMIGVSGVVFVMALDGRITTVDGWILFAGIVGYTSFAIRKSRAENAAVREEYAGAFQSGRAWGIAVHAGLVLLGLVVLTGGARLLIYAAVRIALALGMSEFVIGLTIVAVGTSLPELATSVVAVVHGERDIAAGNVVGSNLFNLLCVLGLTAVVVPGGIRVTPAALHFDLPVMIAVSFACLPIFFVGNRIERWEGGVFVVYYASYVTYLVLNASAHDALPVFSDIMIWFVIPLTAITLVVIGVRKRASSRGR